MVRSRSRATKQDQVEVEEEMEVDEEEGKPLQFDDALTWRAGKPIAVAELLRRLRSLFEELESIDQEDGHRPSLEPKAQELANPLLLSHKDKGVKAYTMLSIVEMFRLLAPDAPYSGPQLKSIFTLFISTIVPALATPSDPYNSQHHGALSSLHNFKSITLLVDIPGSDNLILSLFSNCFDVLSGNIRGATDEQVGKNVEFHMTGLLSSLIDECPTLPNGVIDVVLAQFLRTDPLAANQGSKKGIDEPSEALQEVSPAYNMARSVCNTCPEKMVRHIGNYFSSVLVDASQGLSNAKPAKPKGRKRTHDESEDESEITTLIQLSDEDLENIDKAHRLLRELWRSCSDVIRNVVPQLETELGVDNISLRTLAVQTIGDMVAGIGAAGPPPASVLNPAAFPSQSIDDSPAGTKSNNILLIPDAPHAFSSIYPVTYQAFMDRCRDKSPVVRSAWVIEAGRIVATSGGGKGLDSEQETILLRRISDMLVDQDEKVRLAAVQAVENFEFSFILTNLGNNGGVSTPGSVLFNLTGRIKDPKHPVRLAAVQLLGRIWGVASGAIAEGRDRVRDLLGPIPSKIFEAMYINDRNLNALIQQVTFESLLPVGFPAIKSKAVNGSGSQPIPDSQSNGEKLLDPDEVRAERILCMLRDLEDKGKAVFFSLQQQQCSKAIYLERIIELCQQIQDETGDAAKGAASKKLETYIRTLSSQFPDPQAAISHLTAFFDHFDRRNHSLIRFCCSAESDYKKVANATKELTKRIEQASATLPGVAETMFPFIRSAARLVYNRSHVPAIMRISRTDTKGLGPAAHDMLKEISIKAPSVFKVHIKELCESLKNQAPTASAPSDPIAVDSLKACAGFAQRFPSEIAQDRAFFQAMTNFALYGLPSRAAKYAVSVIAASADRKEMYITDILKQCLKSFKYGKKHFLSKLAAISQLRLLSYSDTESQEEAISKIFTDILGDPQNAEHDIGTVSAESIDVDLSARLWSLRIAVNGLRGYRVKDNTEEPSAALREVADPVFKLLNTIIQQDGELSGQPASPDNHAPQLRLAAAKHLLKLCCDKVLDKLFLPADLIRLSRVAQDTLPEVRVGFNTALKKYLGQGRLPNRFYSLGFIYAFEPLKGVKEDTITWLKARSTALAKRGDYSMEGVFARFLSLLAHHSDFSSDPGDLEDFVDYILFYLKIVATESNIPTIYSIAQRIKTVQDGIDVDKSENLYVLSDLAEAIIRQYVESMQWSLQILPGKVRLPGGLFRQMPSHALGQEISEKRFLPEELADKLEDLVRERMRSRKRKSNAASSKPSKKAKHSTGGRDKVSSADYSVSKVSSKTNRTIKTPKKTKVRDSTTALISSERRRSARASNTKNYAENEDSDDDDELEQWQADDNSDNEGNQGNQQTSTPPSSEPILAPNDSKAPEHQGSSEDASSSPPKADRGRRKNASSPKTTATRKSARTKAAATRTRNGKDVVDDDAEADDDDSRLSTPPAEDL